MPNSQLNTGFTEILKFTRIEEAKIIESVEIDNQLVYICRMEDHNIHKPDSPGDSLTKAIPIGLFGDGSTTAINRIRLKKGTRVLCAFKDPTSFDRGYLLGTIAEPYTHYPFPQVAAPEGSWKYLNEEGSGFSFGANGITMLIGDHSDMITLGNNSMIFESKGGKSSLKVGQNFFGLKTAPINITANLEKTDMIAENDFYIASGRGRLTLTAQNGKLDFPGGKMDTNAGLIEEKSEQRVVSAGLFKYRGVSGVAFAGPGAATYEVSILEGDTSFFNSLGSFNVGILDPTSEIAMYVGLDEDAAFTNFLMSSSETSLIFDQTGGTKTILSSLILKGSGSFLTYETPASISDLALEASGVNLTFKLTQLDTGKLSFSATSTLLEQFSAGVDSALLKLAALGDATLLGKGNILIASGPLASGDITFKALQLKLDSIMNQIDLLVSEFSGIKVSTSEVVAIPDLKAGPGGLNSSFPLVVSLRQHGHLTLVGPTIQKIPSDQVPLV